MKPRISFDLCHVKLSLKSRGVRINYGPCIDLLIAAKFNIQIIATDVEHVREPLSPLFKRDCLPHAKKKNF